MKTKTITTKQMQAAPLVVMPRTQLAAVQEAQNVDITAFQAKQVELPAGATVWTLEQATEPRMVFQIWQAATLAELDIILGQLLGMNERPSYSGLCVALFAGNRDYMEINQQNHRQVYDYIGTIQDQAAQWWNQYGESLL